MSFRTVAKVAYARLGAEGIEAYDKLLARPAEAGGGIAYQDCMHQVPWTSTSQRTSYSRAFALERPQGTGFGTASGTVGILDQGPTDHIRVKILQNLLPGILRMYYAF